jgi:HAD superfamily phosphatase (TIGR01668 family)
MINSMNFNGMPNVAHKPATVQANPAITLCLPQFGKTDYDHQIRVAPTLPEKLSLIAEQFIASTLPCTTIDSIEDLTPRRLRELGEIKGVIFDLDDTLMPLFSGKFPQAILDQLKLFKKAGIKMGIVTNNIQPEYCQNARDQLREAGFHIPFIEDAHKPDPQGFINMRDHWGLSSSQIAVVGDGYLSDIRCANLLGMKSAQATWFTRSVCGPTISIAQDTITSMFHCVRNHLSSGDYATIIHPAH